MTTANKKLFKPHCMCRRHTGYNKEADVSHNIGLFLGACHPSMPMNTTTTGFSLYTAAAAFIT